MYNNRITEVHPNVKFYFLEWHFLWPTILVLTRFLREKRLSNAQGRELCEANAGHAPRAMVIWGRGIVGDEEEEITVGGDDRFWSVSHIRRRYTKPVFTGFPLQLYGYRTVTADLYLHAFPGGYPGIELLKFLGGIIENRLTQKCRWSTASKFGFCRKFAHGENVFHHSFTLIWLTMQYVSIRLIGKLRTCWTPYAWCEHAKESRC